MKRITPLIFLIFLMNLVNAQDVYRKIKVAQDSSGDFNTIQAAINSTRDLGPGTVEISIKKGIYLEKIQIPSWKHRIKLVGEDVTKTILSNADYSGKINPKSGQKYSTFNSYTLLVEGEHVTVENLTIQNTSCHQGQAVALHVEGDYFIGQNIRILGCQDTLYAARNNSKQYYKNCYIEGTTDFIFGQATAYFEHCEIKSLANSYITAAATDQTQNYGFVFFNCHLTAAENVTQVYLGRPWRPYAKTVFIQTTMDDHILPVGWHNWEGDAMFPNKEITTFYAEYDNIGKGFNPSKRVKWSHQLSKKDAKKYTLEHIFPNWNLK